MLGRATMTMVTSSRSMKVAAHTTRRVHHFLSNDPPHLGFTQPLHDPQARHDRQPAMCGPADQLRVGRIPSEATVMMRLSRRRSQTRLVVSTTKAAVIFGGGEERTGNDPRGGD